MASQLVHEVGFVQCLEGTRIHVAVIGEGVRIHGEGTLGADQAESFAQLYVRACWQAGQNGGWEGEITRG